MHINSNEVLITQNKRIPLETVLPLKSPYIVYIDPSGACNFKCNFCPCNTVDFMNEERHKIMDFKLFKKIIDDMSQFEEQVKVIYLHGFGEPFLNKNLVEMIKYIKEKKVCREIRTTTNGSLLEPCLNQKLVDSGIDLIKISVEALDAKGYSEICGVDFDFDEFINNIKDLYIRSRGKCKISAKIVNASLKNQNDTNKFYEIFSPITDFHFIEEVQEIWPQFKDIVLPQNSVNAIKAYYKPTEETVICTLPLIELTVFSNGVIGACSEDWKFATRYGNALNDDIKELWFSKKVKNFQLAHLTKNRCEIEFCAQCKYKPDDYIDDKKDSIIKNIEKEGCNI